MKLEQHIPIPKEYIEAKDFIKEYRECFISPTPQIYDLKEEYEFNGWSKVLVDQSIHFATKKGFLTGFVPQCTINAKYYINYGHSSTFDINDLAEMNFKGYRLVEKDNKMKMSFLSIDKDNNKVCTFKVDELLQQLMMLPI